MTVFIEQEPIFLVFSPNESGQTVKAAYPGKQRHRIIKGPLRQQDTLFPVGEVHILKGDHLLNGHISGQVFQKRFQMSIIRSIYQTQIGKTDFIQKRRQTSAKLLPVEAVKFLILLPLRTFDSLNAKEPSKQGIHFFQPGSLRDFGFIDTAVPVTKNQFTRISRNLTKSLQSIQIQIRLL